MKPTETTGQEEGFTLVELLVAVFIFGVISTVFYSVMFSGVRGGTVTEASVDVSAEARLGLNRMVRDVREATSLQEPFNATRFSIAVDFSIPSDGDTTDPGEVETFTFVPGAREIRLTTDVNGDGDVIDAGENEVLIEGVTRIGTRDVFSYWSNYLEFDANGDGIATCLEVNDPPPGKSGGNGTGGCDAGEIPFLTNVGFTFRVTSGDGDSQRGQNFFGQAQLRNRR